MNQEQRMNSAPQEEEASSRNWLDLPEDVLASILWRLGAIEILTVAQRVCTRWRSISKDPSMWRSIDMRNLGDLFDLDYDLQKMCRHAVDRSAGQLESINLEYFATDDLLRYITDRSSHVKSLRLVSCYSISDEGLSDIAAKLPLLEDLDISYCSPSKHVIEEVGRRCPLLKSFKLNTTGYMHPLIECDEEALAIAKNMPDLRHLQIFGNKLTNGGLQAILDGCPHLDSLDLRQCFNVKLDGELGINCADRIKDLRRPYDSTDDYPFDPKIPEILSPDYYPSGFSDSEFLYDDDEYYAFLDGDLVYSDGSDASE